MDTPELVLFDLDGTLVDSVPDLAYSVDLALRQLDMPTHGEEKIRSWVGRGAEKLIHAALTGGFNGTADADLFKKCFDLFSDIYLSNTDSRSTLYPGVRDGLDHMTKLNCKLACVTNKRELFTAPVLKAMNLQHDFSYVISGDTLPKKKPEPDQLLFVADKLGIAPERSLMVGDSINDLHAARAAQMPILCVTYGYNHGDNIADSKPDILVDSLAEMIELFPQ